MIQDLPSVKFLQSTTGAWEAVHEPSGKSVVGTSREEAQNGMRQLLGLSEEGTFTQPKTSNRFTGVAQAIAVFLEGPISDALGFHSGWARLEAFTDGVAHIRLGGGCQSCPSSQLTLFNGVRSQLQDRFGDEVVVDVILHTDEV